MINKDNIGFIGFKCLTIGEIMNIQDGKYTVISNKFTDKNNHWIQLVSNDSGRAVIEIHCLPSEEGEYIKDIREHIGEYVDHL